MQIALQCSGSIHSSALLNNYWAPCSLSLYLVQTNMGEFAIRSAGFTWAQLTLYNSKGHTLKAHLELNCLHRPNCPQMHCCHTVVSAQHAALWSHEAASLEWCATPMTRLVLLLDPAVEVPLESPHRSAWWQSAQTQEIDPSYTEIDHVSYII